MKLLTKAQAAREFGVSSVTVGNWVKNSHDGKNLLEIILKSGREYIADTAENRLILRNLAEDGRKHRNTSSFRVIRPSQKLYNSLSNRQLLHLINSLSRFNRIPLELSYIGEGSKVWEGYAIRSYQDKLSNTITNTEEMSLNSLHYLKKTFSPDTHFNIFDIGVGDGSPLKEFTLSLHKYARVLNYHGIDYSPDMLEIAKRNLSKWYKDLFKIHTSIKDINSDAISDSIISTTTAKDKEKKVVNLIMFMGSTIENQYDIKTTLVKINNHLGRDDLFMLGQTLDSPEAIRYFNFGPEKTEATAVNEENSKKIQDLWIPVAMNFTEIGASFKRFYSPQERRRDGYIFLNSDTKLIFENDSLYREIDLRKDRPIEVWRHQHHTVPEIINDLDEAGFVTEYMETSKDGANILTINRVKK